MKKLMIAGLALASLIGSVAVAAPAPNLQGASIIRVDDWRDCREWDGGRHMCRDRDWDRGRWREGDWFGPESCREGHERFIDRWGHWQRCERRVVEWRDCRDWDGRGRVCRDRDWDRGRWREGDWYGRESCREGHERFIDRWGHWQMCRRWR